MAIAAFTGCPFYMGGSGTLDEGKIFSVVQFILERELGEGMWRLGQGIAVDDETLAVDVIAAVGPGEGKPYLDADHTSRHFREMRVPAVPVPWNVGERRDRIRARGADAGRGSPAIPGCTGSVHTASARA